MGMLETRHGAGTFVVRPAPPDGDRVHGDDRPAGRADPGALRDPAPAWSRRSPSVPAARITDDELAEPAREARAHGRASSGSAQAFALLDAEFHRMIHVAARSATMLSLLDGIADLSLRGRTISTVQAGVRGARCSSTGRSSRRSRIAIRCSRARRWPRTSCTSAACSSGATSVARGNWLNHLTSLSRFA